MPIVHISFTIFIESRRSNIPLDLSSAKKYFERFVQIYKSILKKHNKNSDKAQQSTYKGKQWPHPLLSKTKINVTVVPKTNQI